VDMAHNQSLGDSLPSISAIIAGTVDVRRQSTEAAGEAIGNLQATAAANISLGCSTQVPCLPGERGNLDSSISRSSREVIFVQLH
jgi:hypothetical protein